jgi:hypothetical protein
VARIRAVFFDVGETILDETREYGTWADWVGVPRHTFPGTNGDAGCIWPGKDGTRCRKQVQQGLALCCGHAKVLSLQPGRECVWLGCSQAASFRSTCPYHEKRCRGLLDGGR